MNTINPNQLPQIRWHNQNVITTELLAKCYGAQEKQIRQNHANNKSRFVEGIHFFKLEGNDLIGFRAGSQPTKSTPDKLSDLLADVFSFDPFKTENLRVDNIDSQISSKTRALILWTEKGAARHSKILDTDQAWDMYDRLEENYFHPERKSLPIEAKATIKALQTELLKARPRMAKVLRLQNAGFSKAESGRMLGVGETTMRRETSTLKTCGFKVEPASLQLDLFEGDV